MPNEEHLWSLSGGGCACAMTSPGQPSLLVLLFPLALIIWRHRRRIRLL